MPYSRYYRTKLTKAEQQAYDAFVKGAEHYEENIAMPPVKRSSMKRIQYAVDYDNPHLFFVDFRCIHYSFLPDTGEVTELQLDYLYSVKEAERLKKSLEKAAKTIAQGAEGKSPQEAALYLHDRLIHRCEYDHGESRPENHNLIGPLLDHKCVCEGYAKAYKYLADKIKLRCMVVCGEAIHPDGSGGGHAWNLIHLEKNNYHVDVTFDLLVGNRYCSRAYYGLSTNEILYDHKFESIFPIPDCPVSGSVLKKVSGTQELIEFLKDESLHGKDFSQVRLTKGFTGDKLMEMMKNKLTFADMHWYRRLGNFWYTDKAKTLSVCWK